MEQNYKNPPAPKEIIMPTNTTNISKSSKYPLSHNEKAHQQALNMSDSPLP